MEDSEEFPSMIYMSDYFYKVIKDVKDVNILVKKVPELIKESFYET